MFRLAFLLAILVPLVLARADTAPKLESRFHREGAIEIRSYGERPRDLLALLMPFLAKREFSRSDPISEETASEGSATFTGRNGNFLSTAGHVNCIVVVYLSLSVAKGTRALNNAENFSAFRTALSDYLSGLPTPRPVPRDIEWGTKACVDTP